MRLPAVLFSVLAAALAVVVNTSTLSQPGLSRRVLGKCPDSGPIRVRNRY